MLNINAEEIVCTPKIIKVKATTEFLILSKELNPLPTHFEKIKK